MHTPHLTLTPKLSNRVVGIWPDNDKPGIDAAKNIANHIDCHNGFNGLVSVVDTAKLGLPEKWDLADEIPKDSDIATSNLSSIMAYKRDTTAKVGKQLELSQELVINLGKDNKRTLGSIDMLVATNRISKDEYISKEIYHDSLISIVNSKNIDLGQIEDHKDFVSSINNVQTEYQSLHREYEQNILRKQNIATSISSNSKSGLNTKEQLAHDLIRDTSVLHQVQLGQNKLTATHTEHIERTVNAEIGKMQRFTDSDMEHSANNVYKTINSPEWRNQLDTANLERTSGISLRFTAKSINQFLVGTNHNEAQGHLENIRKYSIDESDILTTFKEGHAAGTAELKEMSDKLTIASGFAQEHSLVIDEARSWGYTASDLDITKSLVGMNSKKSLSCLKEIRNEHLAEHLENNIEKVDVDNINSLDEVKTIITSQQQFLKETYEEVRSPKYLGDYGDDSSTTLYDGMIVSKDPEILDKLFGLCDTIQANNMQSDKELYKSMVMSTGADQLTMVANEEIEKHNVKTIPAQLVEIREQATSVDSAFTAIEKEQNHLADQHGNIKYYDHDKELIAQCEKAIQQRDNKDLDNLKAIADKALKTGAKTNESLLADLKHVTDLKDAHTQLDKDIEAHHINSTLDQLATAKEAATTSKEVIGILREEEEFLSGLHGNLRHDHGVIIANKVEDAVQAQSNNDIDHMRQTALYAHKNEIVSSDDMLNHLKSGHNTSDIHDSLTTMCHDHHSIIIDKHYDLISEGHTISHDGHKFDCPIKYLEHWKNNTDHHVLPIDHINNRIQQEHDHQHEMEHSRTMDL